MKTPAEIRSMGSSLSGATRKPQAAWGKPIRKNPKKSKELSWSRRPAVRKFKRLDWPKLIKQIEAEEKRAKPRKNPGTPSDDSPVMMKMRLAAARIEKARLKELHTRKNPTKKSKSRSEWSKRVRVVRSALAEALRDAKTDTKKRKPRKNPTRSNPSLQPCASLRERHNDLVQALMQYGHKSGLWNNRWRVKKNTHGHDETFLLRTPGVSWRRAAPEEEMPIFEGEGADHVKNMNKIAKKFGFSVEGEEYPEALVVYGTCKRSKAQIQAEDRYLESARIERERDYAEMARKREEAEAARWNPSFLRPSDWPEYLVKTGRGVVVTKTSSLQEAIRIAKQEMSHQDRVDVFGKVISGPDIKYRRYQILWSAEREPSGKVRYENDRDNLIAHGDLWGGFNTKTGEVKSSASALRAEALSGLKL